MPRSPRRVTLCGHALDDVRHVCAFFDSVDEQYEALNPYFSEGLAQREEVLTIVESDRHDDHVRRMEAGGVPTDTALASGQLKVLASDDTYLKDGIFVADRMFDTLQRALEDSRRGPNAGIRTCGDMEWALKNLPGTDELMQYESRVNLLTSEYDCTLLCVYDLNRFSGRAVADVLATHSHVILGGRMYENPYFTDVPTFLQLFALRRASMVPLARDSAAAHGTH
jgi:hypothetical protein